MKSIARFLPFAGLLAAIVTLWLRYQPLSSPDTPFQIELSVTSPASGEAWLRFNIGSGWNAQDTRAIWLRQSAEPQRYRVTLPAGVFKSFRLLPANPKHPATLLGARIVDGEGVAVAETGGATFSSELKTIPFSFPEPLRISAPGEMSWAESALDFVLTAALVTLAAFFLSSRLPRWNCPARLASWAHAHPQTPVFLAALLAVIASAHPVVFFGRSFVSPGNGTLCLYDLQPTLPGAPPHVEEWTRSDVNATPWAHLPYSMLTHDAVLRDGELPLWNRFDMGGVTLLGQGQSMPGDPLFWIPVFANGAAWAWDARFLAAKLLFAFGIGLLVLAVTRRVGVAALLAGSAAFIGFYSFRFNHPAVFTLGYAPWVLLCWLRAAEGESLRKVARWSLALIAANWLLLSSGTAKEASMLLLMLNGAGALTWGGFSIRPPNSREAHNGANRARVIGGLKIRPTLLLAASLALFLGLSAPLWVVFLDALRHAATIYDHPTAHQISPGLALGLFDDLFYRQLVLDEWHVNPSLNFLALAGLLWTVADWRRLSAQPALRALGLTALVAAALVFGVVPRALLERLPLLRNIWHVDNTFTCVLIVLLFPLAGAGIAACLEHSREAEWRATFRRLIAGLMLLAALYLGTVFAAPALDEFALRTTRPTTFSRFFSSYAPALLIAAALLPWLARRLVLRRGSTLLNGGALALCLVAVHFRHGMWLETKFDYYVMNPQPRMDLRAKSPVIETIRKSEAEPARTIGLGRVLQPGFNAVLGLEGVAGADAVGSRALLEWFEATGLGARWVWSPVVTPENVQAVRPFLDAMNVRHYLASAATASAGSLRKVASADLDVFVSDTAWPRAFFTDRVARYDDVRELARMIAYGDGRPFAAVAAREALPLSADTANRRIVPARDYRLRANRTAFTLDAPSAGLAVLAESAVPDDFRVTLNGAPARVVTVNHIFKGVLLPTAGTYRIEFAYWPHLLTPALRVAAVAAALILLGAVFAFRQSTSEPLATSPVAPRFPENSGSPAPAAVASAAP